MNDHALFIAEREAWHEYVLATNAIHRRFVAEDETQRSGYVYLAVMDVDGEHYVDASARVKIGIAKNPEQRLKELSRTPVTMPYRIRLMHTFWAKDALKTERLLHELLVRHRLNGEWFLLPLDMQCVLSSIWFVHVVPNDRFGGEPRFAFADHSALSRTPEDFITQELQAHQRQAKRAEEIRAAELRLGAEVGDIVEHGRFGRGLVTSVIPRSDDIEVWVRFEDGIGEKRMRQSIAQLRPSGGSGQ